jgi:N-acetylmuramoyl-L-alanine amidase
MEYSGDHHKGATGRRGFFAAVLCAASLLASCFLTSCESTGGTYGPGAGIFDTVIVDAGHGGFDQGAKACSGSPEKALTLDTAHRLSTELRRSGLRVIETRPGDYFVTLGRRTDVSNSASRAVFVSVHYNCSPRRGARGIEVYFNSRKSMRLAANILREVLKAYNTPNRGLKNRGFYVLRNNRRPAVLCELGFVSNPDDNRNLQSAAVRQNLAERVAAGILAEQAGRNP